MAAFYNTATLSYRDTSTNSNTVEGQLVQVLAAEKTAVLPTYGSSNTVTYIVSIRNSGAAAYTGLTVTDDLGGYAFAGETRVPLTYVEGSLKYYSNGTLQPAPTVTAGAPLVIGGITVPAGGNALLIYEAEPNGYAPACRRRHHHQYRLHHRQRPDHPVDGTGDGGSRGNAAAFHQ